MILDEADWAQVREGLLFVLREEFLEFKKQFPRAYVWHEAWSEFRSRLKAQPCKEHGAHFIYEADFVVVFRNQKTNKTQERLVLRGEGQSLDEAVVDVLALFEETIEFAEEEATLPRPSTLIDTTKVKALPGGHYIYNPRVLASHTSGN